MPTELAAVLPLAGSTALQALRDDGRLVAGERVLIVGAGGGVGTFAVQLAKRMGAYVTTVASERHRSLLASLHADRILDRAKDDPFTGQRYDVVLDAFGKLRLRDVAPALSPRGRFVSLVPSAGILRDMMVSRLSGTSVRLTVVRPRARDLADLVQAMRDGTLRPIVDRAYSRSQLLEAMQHLETRKARGKIAIVA